MEVIDETKSLFEHIRNRLPTGYGLGDDETVYKDNVPDHAVFQQSLREDCEGDVGSFGTLTSEVKIVAGAVGWNTKIQIAVVTKQGDIDNAYKYLLEAFENIKKAVEMSPDNADYLMLLARIQYSRGNYNEAVAAYRKISNIATENNIKQTALNNINQIIGQQN